MNKKRSSLPPSLSFPLLIHSFIYAGRRIIHKLRKKIRILCLRPQFIGGCNSQSFGGNSSNGYLCFIQLTHPCLLNLFYRLTLFPVRALIFQLITSELHFQHFYFLNKRPDTFLFVVFIKIQIQERYYSFRICFILA